MKSGLKANIVQKVLEKLKCCYFTAHGEPYFELPLRNGLSKVLCQVKCNRNGSAERTDLIIHRIIE